MKRLRRASRDAVAFGALALGAVALHEIAIGAAIGIGVALLLGAAGVADAIEAIPRKR